jgi:glucan phosphoethanolaminetransferase (alkaline phosphatase superfamily)
MALKLFRSTGYSSILSPGETRMSTHPAWMIAAISAWAGFACNVALWRALSAPAIESPALLRATLIGLLVSGVCGLILSLLGWRKTLKPAATLILLLASLSASAIWMQGIPVDANLLNNRLSTLIPNWTILLRWRVLSTLLVIGLVPIVWVWHTAIRRLPGPRQLATNLKGAALSAGLMIASALLLGRGLF